MIYCPSLVPPLTKEGSCKSEGEVKKEAEDTEEKSSAETASGSPKGDKVPNSSHTHTQSGFELLR